MTLSRRGFVAGLVGLVAAPAVLRLPLEMPVRGIIMAVPKPEWACALPPAVPGLVVTIINDSDVPLDVYERDGPQCFDLAAGGAAEFLCLPGRWTELSKGVGLPPGLRSGKAFVSRNIDFGPGTIVEVLTPPVGSIG